MSRFLALVAATGFTLAMASGVQAQNRNFGARTFTMDDGAGHTFTMQAPSGMTGNVTYSIPLPPAGNPPAGFVNVGTSAGQTLFWNGTTLAWEASNVITNNTNGNGTNVTITGPLLAQSSLGVAGATTLSALSTAGVVHNSAAGLLSTSQVATADIANSAVDLTSKVTSVLPVANGGTGSATQNFVDLTTTQSVAGNKTFTGSTTANTLASSGATITGGTITGTSISGSTGSFTTLGASTSETFSNLSTAGVVHNAASGLLSTSQVATADIANGAVDLTSKVTGVLPVANGGTGGGSFLPLSGGTMTGAINMNSHQINGVSAPTLGADAANKTYVDNAAGGPGVAIAWGTVNAAGVLQPGSFGCTGTVTHSSTGSYQVALSVSKTYETAVVTSAFLVGQYYDACIMGAASGTSVNVYTARANAGSVDQNFNFVVFGQ